MGNMEAGVAPLARPDDETDAALRHNTGVGKFGSAHPGIVNFLIGDGAVRAFPLTTPSRIIGALGTVNDGNNVQMPTM